MCYTKRGRAARKPRSENNDIYTRRKYLLRKAARHIIERNRRSMTPYQPATAEIRAARPVGHGAAPGSRGGAVGMAKLADKIIKPIL